MTLIPCVRCGRKHALDALNICGDGIVCNECLTPQERLRMYGFVRTIAEKS